MTDMIDTRERRLIESTEVRFEKGSDGVRISGHAAVFNSMSRAMTGARGKFQEVIVPGAFRSALAEKQSVPLLIEHDGLALADTATGTLKLSEDERGLAFNALLDPEDPDVQRVVPKLKRGTLRSMSFSFRVGEQRFERATEGFKRFVETVRSLDDISLVTSPAYLSASVALRSFDAWQKEQEPEVLSTRMRDDAARRLLLLDT